VIVTLYDNLLGAAQAALPETLEQTERGLYPRAARGIHSGELLDSQLERVLKTLSAKTGVGYRAVVRSYRTVAAADPEREDGEDDGARLTQSQLLVEVALEHVSDLFHSQDETAYALMPVADHYEVLRVRGKAFRTLLYGRFYAAHGKPPGAQAVQDALGVLEAKARFDGEQRPVFVRIAEQADKVYLDLGDDLWRVVEVDPHGWRILARSPVHFARPKGLQALPTPCEGGSVETLRRFIHLEDADWHLLLGFLVACLYPRGPYPLLLLLAEQGSGKTTLARIIKLLIDANAAPVRSAPRDERDLMVAAQNSWLLCFDNLSGIPSALSDSLARLSTGAGFSTRELYSDAEETIFAASRPLLLTAIDDVMARSDLLDRAITLNLKRIDKGERQTERELWRDLEDVLPGVLGALLSAVAVGIWNLPNTKIENAPRMADFATFATACEPGLGLEPGTILKAYRANRAGATALALETSPVTTPLKLLLEAQQPNFEGVRTLETTAADLLFMLEAKVDDATRRHKSWPNTPRALSGALRRIAPNLREVGLHIDFDTRSSRKRTISFRLELPLENDSETPSLPSSPSQGRDDARQGRESINDGRDNDTATDDGRNLRPSHLPSPQEARAGRQNDGSDGSDAGIRADSKTIPMQDLHRRLDAGEFDGVAGHIDGVGVSNLAPRLRRMLEQIDKGNFESAAKLQTFLEAK